MDKRVIGVVVTDHSGDFLPTLEAALKLRDESVEPTMVALCAIGGDNSAAERAREGLFRGADYAAVLSDPLFEGVGEMALLHIIEERVKERFDTIVTSGQGTDCRPRNAHLVLRYKRATTLAERTEGNPYNYLYNKHPHLTIDSWSAADLGITADDLPKELMGETSDGIFGLGEHTVVTLAEQSDTLWARDIARLLLANRPQRLSRRLREAQLVVGGGYGVGSAEGFENLSEFASEIKARMGATRAAVDAEFCPAKLMIGPTGERIHPKLYLACGISGQVQHIAGIAEGTPIIAINTDAEAPIMEIANYAIVGTVEEAVPQILEHYRELRNK